MQDGKASREQGISGKGLQWARATHRANPFRQAHVCSAPWAASHCTMWCAGGRGRTSKPNHSSSSTGDNSSDMEFDEIEVYTMEAGLLQRRPIQPSEPSSPSRLSRRRRRGSSSDEESNEMDFEIEDYRFSSQLDSGELGGEILGLEVGVLGAGRVNGAGIGAIWGGAIVVWLLDKCPRVCAHLKRHWRSSQVVCIDVKDMVESLDKGDLQSPDVVIGSMPCEPWTMGSVHTRKCKHHCGLVDARGQTILQCYVNLKWMGKLQGGWFENVKGMLDKKNRNDLITLCECLGSSGVGCRHECPPSLHAALCCML